MKRPLTDIQVRKATGPAKLSDGKGLLLRVTSEGSKQWEFRYFRNGDHSMGLGGYPDVSLAEAREKAADARKLLRAGKDPLAARNAVTKPVRFVTFDQAMREQIEAFKAGWRGPRHSKIRLSRLKRHASPVLGKMDVRDIDTEHVLKVLAPIWATKTETAAKIREYLEAVFDWCRGQGYRDKLQPNPATWRGNLSALLPARAKVQKTTHHPAMPFDRVHVVKAFVESLSWCQGDLLAAPDALDDRPFQHVDKGVCIAPMNMLHNSGWILDGGHHHLLSRHVSEIPLHDGDDNWLGCSLCEHAGEGQGCAKQRTEDGLSRSASSVDGYGIGPLIMSVELDAAEAHFAQRHE